MVTRLWNVRSDKTIIQFNSFISETKKPKSKSSNNLPKVTQVSASCFSVLFTPCFHTAPSQPASPLFSGHGPCFSIAPAAVYKGGDKPKQPSSCKRILTGKLALGAWQRIAKSRSREMATIWTVCCLMPNGPQPWGRRRKEGCHPTAHIYFHFEGIC